MEQSMDELPEILDDKVTCKTYKHYKEWVDREHKNGIKGLCVNIRSIHKYWNELMAIIKEKGKNFDILTLVETNTAAENMSLYTIEGYKQYFYNRINRRGGGIMVFIKNEHAGEEFNLTTKNTYEQIHIKVKIEKRELDIISIYRPPNSDKNAFMNELEEQLSTINKKNSIICMGDFNIDMKSNSNYSNQLESITSSKGLIQSIDDFTREEVVKGKTTQSCIDLIFTRGQGKESHAGVIRNKIADHYMIALNFQTEEKKQDDPKIKIIKKIINETKLRKLLIQDNKDWNKLQHINDPEILHNTLTNILKEIREKCSKEWKAKKRRDDKDWINEELKKLIMEKDKKFRKHKSNPTNELLKKDYKRHRNKVIKKIRMEKNKHYQKKFEQCLGNVKKTWELVNSLSGKRINSIDNTIDAHLGKLGTEKEIAENFAMSYMEDIENAKHNCCKSIYEGNSSSIDKCFFLPKATPTDVIKIIDELKVNKAPGYDGIQGVELKVLKESISKYIAQMINWTIETGKIPQQLKIAINRPIYKSGSHKDYNNYRQIAKLSLLGKIMEKYMGDKLRNYLKDYDILTTSQHGFQENRSTETLLSQFTNLIHERLDKQEHVLVTYVDYTKAFDLLDKEVMIRELRKIGVCGKALNWFRNYMSDRQYVVQYKNVYSDLKTSNSAIAQGSVLGPLLYIIYTNCLEDRMEKKHTKVFMYADDIAIITFHKNLELAETIMQTNFDTLQRFSHDYKLVINSKKTKVTHIRSPQQITRDINIIFHTNDCLHDDKILCRCNQRIGMVDNFKYLGVTIDWRFKFDEHIQNVAKKLRTCLYIFYHIQFFIKSRETKILIYKALAESHVRYGILSYGNTTKTYLNIIHNLQERILKIINNNKKDEPIDLFKKFNILSAKNLFTYKLIVDNYFEKTYKIKILHDIHTRSITENKYVIPTITNEYGRQTLKYAIPTTFNKLNNKLLSLTKYSEIKNKIKEWVLNNQ